MNVENQRRTTQIVAAYVRRNPIPTDQIGGLITSVHSTLSGLGSEVVEEPPRIPAVSIRRSVRPDHIICIECGYKGKMIKRHLQSKHGLSAAQYRVRWKLPSDYSTTAADYSERRSQLAKSLGLGRGRAQSAKRSATARVPETTPEKPARGRSAGKAARTRTSAKKASPKKANSTTRASKAIRTRTSAKKASPKKATSRSRPRTPSFRATSKAASARKAATA
jgi:predicted transcriptional regulator